MKAKRRRTTILPENQTDSLGEDLLNDDHDSALPDSLPPSEEVLKTEEDVVSKEPKSFLLPGIVITFLIAIAVLVIANTDWFRRGPAQSPASSPIPARYSGERSFKYLKALCDFGPRPSGSAAMSEQQNALKDFFTKAGATVQMQSFQIRHPQDGSNVTLSNLIASFNLKAAKRFLVCAHYDTRPFPDRDATNPTGVFVGANDGASGTAGLMELANQMGDLPADVGVDLVMFDDEEFVFQQGRDDYFLGSTFFAKKYAQAPPTTAYQAGILLDMIGDKELTLYYERNSMRYARSVAKSVWRTADKLGVRAFISRSRRGAIDDDHIPLNEFAKIPTIDIIDFDYPRAGVGAPSYWHTEKDVPANCSGESIAAVVWVVHEWIKSQ